MKSKQKPDSAIKFRNFCFNNNLEATDIAKILDVSTSLVYKYWAGTVSVPDESKKKLEKEIGLNIYEVFYEEL